MNKQALVRYRFHVLPSSLSLAGIQQQDLEGRYGAIPCSGHLRTGEVTLLAVSVLCIGLEDQQEEYLTGRMV